MGRHSAESLASDLSKKQNMKTIKHTTLPLYWAALSLLLLFLSFDARPGLAQSRAAKTKAWKTSDVAPAASLIEAEKAGVNTRQVSAVKIDNVVANSPDTLFNCTWTASTAFPITILDNAVVSVGGILYSFGGVSTSITGNCYKFDGTTWTPIASLPIALEFPSAVTDGTNIYILGGAEPTAGTPQTTVYRYNVAANTYTTLAPFTVGTWNQATIYLSGKIYKFCGTGPATSSTNVLEIYDVAGNTWTTGASYPITESFVSAWGQGTFIYAAGGIDGATSVATTKTYRYDTVANVWDDASIADLPLTRWGAASALYTDGVLAGGYVDGVATANISASVISWDMASNTWQTVPNMLGERARFNGAVLNGSFYAIGGRSIASSAFVGTNDNQKLLCLNVPTNIISAGGKTIDSAGPNGVLDPSESVTVSLGVLNVGGPGVVCTSALTGTLQASGGVTVPSGPQNYGAVCSGNPPVFRSFIFTVDPALPCGSTVTATLHMMDGATDYGNVSYTFITGSSAVAVAQNFDGVVVPALPSGWTADQGINTAGAPLWVTSNSGVPTPVADSLPNAAFSQDPANLCDNRIYTPIIMYAAGSRLTFRQNYDLEQSSATVAYDAGVLEISISGGAYTDIITAGGTFVSGGYNHTDISTGFSNPLLPTRPNWSGISNGGAGGFETCTVNLPAAGAGLPVQLRWRMGSDSSVSHNGWRIDNVSIANPVCGGSAPAVTSAVSRKVHGAAGSFDVNLPLVGLTGAVGVEDRKGVAGEHQVVVTFANPVTVGSASVTAGSIGSSSVVGNVVTLNLTGVANAQRLGIALSNVSDGVNLGSTMIPMGVLAGDTNGNGVVTATDVSQTKGQSGQAVTGANFREDVIVNGSINATDVSGVKSNSGTALP